MAFEFSWGIVLIFRSLLLAYLFLTACRSHLRLSTHQEPPTMPPTLYLIPSLIYKYQRARSTISKGYDDAKPLKFTSALGRGPPPLLGSYTLGHRPPAIINAELGTGRLCIYCLINPGITVIPDTQGQLLCPIVCWSYPRQPVLSCSPSLTLASSASHSKGSCPQFPSLCLLRDLGLLPQPCMMWHATFLGIWEYKKHRFQWQPFPDLLAYYYYFK